MDCKYQVSMLYNRALQVLRGLYAPSKQEAVCETAYEQHVALAGSRWACDVMAT